jgi:hypothetical protein
LPFSRSPPLNVVSVKKTGRRSGNKKLERNQPEKNTSPFVVFFLGQETTYLYGPQMSTKKDLIHLKGWPGLP